MGMGMVSELHPDVWGVWKKFKMTNFVMPNNIYSMKYALKSVPGLADFGALHSTGMAPKLHPDVWRGFGKSVKRLLSLCLTMSLL